MTWDLVLSGSGGEKCLLFTSKPANQWTGKAWHTCVVYTNNHYIIIIMKAIKTNDNCYDYKVLLVIYFKL